MSSEATIRAIDDAVDFWGRISEVGSAAGELVANAVENAMRLVDDLTADSRAVAGDALAVYTAAVDAAAVARDAARATPRFARIVQDVLRIAAAYRIHARLADAAGAWLGAAALDDLHRDSAERLYRLCVDLRGGVLKLGQFASTRVDLLPDAYVDALSRLQDRVPPVPTSRVRLRIEEELGAPVERLFGRFEAEPIAAASLAQVHRAELADGSPVAVKVQVPGIERIVETDLAALRVIVPMLGDLLPAFDLDTIARELARALRGELDYVAEAESAAAFHANFAADPDVVVPRVYRSLSSRRVLALEYVEGSRLMPFFDDCERRGEAGARDRDRIFATLIRCFCAQVLQHGLFQADPHPGNFLVVDGTDGPRLALLDFGNVQSYSAAERRSYAELALSILSRDRERMARLLASIGFRSRSGDVASLEEFAELLLEVFREGELPKFDADPRERMERVLELTRENPIVRIPDHFVQLGRVFASLGGLLMRYRPRVDLFQILMPYLIGAAAGSTE